MRSSDAMAARARPATARQVTKAARAGSPPASAEKKPSRKRSRRCRSLGGSKGILLWFKVYKFIVQEKREKARERERERKTNRARETERDREREREREIER